LRHVRVAVLASGTGSLLEAILQAGVPVSLVVVDRPCRATEIAVEHGVQSACVERASFGTDFDRTAYTEAVVDTLQSHDIDLVVMAGFGTVFDKPIFDAYENRIINTHPALLPAFKGWHAVEAALAYGVKVTGCTVHVATLEVDSGPILAQEAVPVLAGDTAETLHERIKTVERRLYVDTINEIIARGSVLP
jgi:phosphoribosylglycinamide formyltransferase-1